MDDTTTDEIQQSLSDLDEQLRTLDKNMREVNFKIGELGVKMRNLRKEYMSLVFKKYELIKKLEPYVIHTE